ncbi:MAG: J domain-containing protein [Alphaproteobacteria bacterium]|nr:J domain-containing protein [Alphaproteobacteria bacterium]MCB1551871.1 J domain-containing protein [Alphaproteobacteria bacterium]MCB9984816.1 J domain-containing protein [Micavibrio sp.]
MPECQECGDFKAPKDRALSEYYWFCLPHVQEYNKAWDFFSGMSPADIEHHINKSTVWDRPTQRHDSMFNETLRQKAWQTYNFTDEEPPKSREYHNNTPSRNTPELEALALLGIEPPVTLEGIKTRYKILVKKYHPDHIGPDTQAEELLKKINMAFTILRMAYQKFETLPEK